MVLLNKYEDIVVFSMQNVLACGVCIADGHLYM